MLTVRDLQNLPSDLRDAAVDLLAFVGDGRRENGKPQPDPRTNGGPIKLPPRTNARQQPDPRTP